MATINAPSTVRTYILEHMLESLERTPAQDEPFSHFYIENVFPDEGPAGPARAIGGRR